MSETTRPRAAHRGRRCRRKAIAEQQHGPRPPSRRAVIRIEWKSAAQLSPRPNSSRVRPGPKATTQSRSPCNKALQEGGDRHQPQPPVRIKRQQQQLAGKVRVLATFTIVSPVTVIAEVTVNRLPRSTIPHWRWEAAGHQRMVPKTITKTAHQVNCGTVSRESPVVPTRVSQLCRRRQLLPVHRTLLALKPDNRMLPSHRINPVVLLSSLLTCAHCPNGKLRPLLLIHPCSNCGRLPFSASPCFWPW